MAEFKASILVVEDEEHLQEALTLNLELEGYEVTCADNGAIALKKVEEGYFDLIILDVMLPEVDGFDVCESIRLKNIDTPILMLSARAGSADRVMGLKRGADDYLTKPFNPRELIARVKAILRRSDNKKQADSNPIHRGDLTIVPTSREARLASRTLDLRTQEFDLLLILAEQPGRVFTREQLLQLAWGFDFYGQTRTVDVHIAHLRKKLEGGSVKIETVTGVGYKLVT